MAYTDFNNTGISFLHGTQDSLNALIKNGGAVEGAFYLTKDTHRLYVGRKLEDNSIVPVAVNEGVIVVDTLEKLPEKNTINAGEFYYISEKNILCIYNGQDFVQINPDTDTNTYYEYSITQDTDNQAKKNQDTGDLEVYFNLNSQKKEKELDVGEPNSEPITLTIPNDVFSSMSVNVAVGLNGSLDDNTLNLSTAGTGAASGSVLIKGGSNIEITEADGNYVITGTNTEYTFAVDEEGLNIKSGNSEVLDVAFKADEEGPISVNIDTTNKTITYSHDKKTAVDENTENSNPLLTNGGSFNIISGITSDEYGHLVSADIETITLPTVADSKVGSVTAEGGKIKISSVNHNDVEVGTVTSGEEDVLYYSYGKEEKETATNQGHLNVYTTSEIDKLMVGLNALVYQSVTEVLPVPTEVEPIKAGYVYYVGGTGFSIDANTKAEPGDLLIAHGTEVDGSLPSENLQWQVVPSGNEKDTLFRIIGSESDKSIKLQSSTTGTNWEDSTSIVFKDDDIVNVAVTEAEISISHVATGLEQINDGNLELSFTNGSVTIPVISNITHDSTTGHVTSYTNKNYILKESAYEIGSELSDNSFNVNLKKGNTDAGTASLKIGEGLIIEDVKDSGITLKHEVYGDSEKIIGTYTEIGQTQLNFEDSFSALVYGKTENGHITDLKVETFTLPAQTAYSLVNDVVTNSETERNSMTIGLLAGESEAGTLKFVSDSLVYAEDEDNGTYSIDLVWGTF